MLPKFYRTFFGVKFVFILLVLFLFLRWRLGKKMVTLRPLIDKTNLIILNTVVGKIHGML